MKSLFFLFIITTICLKAFTQKPILVYPFKFEKKGLKEPDNDANFLVDKGLDNIAFVLHDIKKAEYVMTDPNFKVISKFTLPVENSIFDMSHPANKEEFLGGSGLPGTGIFNYLYKTTTNQYRLVYNKSDEAYRVETVNFNTKTVSQKEFAKVPGHEKLIVSFTDYGECFLFMADNKTNELIVYNLGKDGQTIKKNISFKIPPGKGKNRNSLSEYLEGTKLVKDDEEAELETATQSSKLFSTADKFIFIINEASAPTHAVTIDKNTFSLTEKFIDHNSLLTGSEKEKSYVNSFLADGKLFTLALNKKNIQVAVYNLQDGQLMMQQDITEENYEKLLSVLPVSKERKGSKEKEEEVEEYKKLVKALTKGTEGLLVTKNAANQYIITVGTYDHIIIPSGGSIGSTHISTTVNASSYGGAVPASSFVYTPGVSRYTTGGSNYYKTTSFTLLLNAAALTPVKGKVKPTAGDQIKDYMDGRSGRVKKQFSKGDKQYLGYYDKDSETYVIENIPIRK